MRVRMLMSAAVFFILVTGMCVGQEKSNVTIKKVPAPHTSPASGQEMYVSYCAACHGRDGTGNGPAAAALKVVPTDLTMLAKKNGGEFPAAHVVTILAGAGVAAHGSETMPVWGPVFRKISNGDNAQVVQRTANLSKYLESLQK